MSSLIYALWAVSLSFAIILIGAAWQAYKTNKDIFNPSTFVAIWFFFLYPVEILIYLLSEQGFLPRSGLLYPHKQPVEQYLLLAALLAAFGWVGWAVGWHIRLGSSIAKRLALIIPKQLKPGDLKPVAFFYAFLSVSSISLLVYASGGPQAMISRGDFAIPPGMGLGVPAILSNLAYAALGLFLVMGSQVIGFLLTLVIAIYHALINARATAVTAFLLPLLVRHYTGRSIITPIKAFLLFILMLFVAAVGLGVVLPGRAQPFYEKYGIARSALLWLQSALMQLGVAEETALYLEYIPSDLSYAFGLPYIYRSLGPIGVRFLGFGGEFWYNYLANFSQQYVTGMVLDERIGIGSGGGVSIFYINFGPPFVFIGYFICGILMRMFYTHMLVRKSNDLEVVLYVWAFYSILYKSSFGGFDNIVWIIIYSFLPLLFPLYVVSMIRKGKMRVSA